ncbi:MAG: hypothetical protein JWM11_5437 [Planctomycetaceae bacterium]|nr:hypothetical protein [Planctomycetaceae bacterium]
MPELQTSPVPAISMELRLDERGIWCSNSRDAISYPEDGNHICFQLEDASYWFQHRNTCIISMMSRFPPTGPVVDIGGGNGYVTRAMLDQGFQAILLEPGYAGALNAKLHRGVSEVICSDLKNARFLANSVAAVGLFDVLEHIEDDRGFVRNLHEILKPDGLLYATVPAHNWLWSQSDVHAGHFRRYNRRMLERSLGPEFRLEWFSYLFGPLTIPIFLLRSIPTRLGLGRQKKVLGDQAEHGTSGGVSVNVMKWLLAREARTIIQGRSTSVGTSCLFVARKR